jgi:hypothetical protein
MISRGYDSVAVAALASKAGCCEAVTYRESGSANGTANDDGSEIGRVLGYRTTVYQRPEPGAAAREGEEEFYMEPWGVDREVLPMEAQLVGSMLLSGRSTSGWEVGASAYRGRSDNGGLPDLQRPIAYTPGCALTDFRMRVGFLHFAVPAIGAIYAPALRRLTVSDEMRPWKLGGPYDKPIPRRLAEEAGVPRHLFGSSKMGGPKGTRSRASHGANLRRSFRKAMHWTPLRVLLRHTIGHWYRHPRWRMRSFDVQVAAATMVERYRRALSGSL